MVTLNERSTDGNVKLNEHVMSHVTGYSVNYSSVLQKHFNLNMPIHY